MSKKRGDLFLDGNGANDLGLAQFDQHRTFGLLDIITDDSDLS
jgi:hypothetical protein